MKEQHIIREQHVLDKTYENGLNFLPMVLSDSDRMLYAEVFKAFGDETRLKLISFLTQAPACLCEMVDALGVANSTLSHHLKLLERGDVVKKEKVGKYTVYQLNDTHIVQVLLTLLMREGDKMT